MAERKSKHEEELNSAEEKHAGKTSGDEADRESQESGNPDEPESREFEENAEESAVEADGAETAETKDDWQDRYLRLAADFDNFKKRTAKEKTDIYAHANEKFAVDLLDVLDNFERAISQETKETADVKFIEGLEMIFKQFMDVLIRNDVSEIEAVGAEFDPNVHHAVMTEPAGAYESGVVTEVLQKGYKLKDKVIRPAMVKVAQ